MIQFTSITRDSNGNWSFTWPSTGASYYRVVLYGMQQAKTALTTWTYSSAAFRDFPPPIEIAHENQQVLTETYKSFLTLQWYGLPACSRYLVEQYNGSSWVPITQVQETGRWVYTYQSPVLSDETFYQYRVTAVDSVGNTSTPRQYYAFMVTPPSPPSVNMTYNGTLGAIIVN